MPNLVGIGNSQVPTNSMLGGLAYQNPKNASLESVDIKNIAKYKASTAETPGDIRGFLYTILQMIVMEEHGEREHSIQLGIMNN